MQRREFQWGNRARTRETEKRGVKGNGRKGQEKGREASRKPAELVDDQYFCLRPPDSLIGLNRAYARVQSRAFHMSNQRAIQNGKSVYGLHLP